MSFSLQSSGCLGCDTRPKLNSSLPDSFRGQENHALTKSQASLSEDFWTTSACEVDNAAAVQSCGNISFTSTLPQMHDVHGAGCSSKPSKFVNHGLILWNQRRQKWIGNKGRASGPRQQRDPKLSWNETYDSLLSADKPFQQPIPLGEMIDFLVDIWEQEGMYD